MRRWPALGLGGAAFLFLAVLAFHGERPEPGLSEFKVAGVMAATDPAAITEIVVRRGSAERRLTRGDPNWLASAEAIEHGLKFLHVTAPERVMTAAKVASVPAGDFGLAPPALSVALRSDSGPVLTIGFGRANPLGLARYARIEGRPDVIILPGYVAAPWEKVAGG
jgi:hypothetical protein